MKNLQYGVLRISSTTMRRLLESFSTVCENFPEQEGDERRRNEVTVGIDEGWDNEGESGMRTER